MVVTKCKECPFFHETLVSLLAKEGGVCAYDRDSQTILKPDLEMTPGPAKSALAERLNRRLRIRDQNQLPDQCPLRSGPITVSAVLGN